jgi:hypothetical protein
VEKSQNLSELQLRSKPELRPGLESIITTSSSDTITKSRIESVTEGLSLQYLNHLHRMLPTNKENVLTICDYVSSQKSEVNLSDHYRKDVILLLCKF